VDPGSVPPLRLDRYPEHQLSLDATFLVPHSLSTATLVAGMNLLDRLGDEEEEDTASYESALMAFLHPEDVLATPKLASLLKARKKSKRRDAASLFASHHQTIEEGEEGRNRDDEGRSRDGRASDAAAEGADVAEASAAAQQEASRWESASDESEFAGIDVGRRIAEDATFAESADDAGGWEDYHHLLDAASPRILEDGSHETSLRQPDAIVFPTGLAAQRDDGKVPARLSAAEVAAVVAASKLLPRIRSR